MAVNLSISPCVYLDTWDGLSNCSFESNGTAFASSLSLVRMFFRDDNNELGLQLSSANGTITIDNAAEWYFTVHPVSPMTLSPGNWYWSIETTDSAGSIKTRVFGTIKILNDATR